MPGAIHCRALTRRFDSLTAVDALDLDVAAGEVFGFLGPNGAGKTTTVRMLAGLIAPTAGEAVVCGQDVRAAPERVRAAVGVLTETPGLYERLTVGENLDLFGRLHGVPDLAARKRKYLDILDLGDRADSFAGTLSKGMRQKVALARALLHEPPVLFLDEPTSGLDPLSARRVRDFVAGLGREGRTIFLCTHNLAEAEQLCDRVAIFRTRLLRTDTLAGLRSGLYGRAVRVGLASGARADAYLPALEAHQGVRAVTAEHSSLRIAVDEPAAITPTLVNLLVNAGAPIVSVAEEVRSLEQIYLDLIDGAAGEGQAA